MRVIALVVASCCIAAWLAEADGEGGAQPTFRSGVELVTIDVVATDRSGKPVHNLKAADFELFEDGKSQPIKTFQFIDASMVPTEAILPPGVVSNDVEPGGIFALVLDEIGYYVTEVQDVRRAAERFLKGALLPHDHVAVVRSGVDSGLHADLRSHSSRSSRFGRRPAAAIAACGSNSPVARRMSVGRRLTSIPRRPVRLGAGSFAVLDAVVDKLRPIPARRKAIIWFSRGGELPANFGQIILEMVSTCRSAATRTALRSLIDHGPRRQRRDLHRRSARPGRAEHRRPRQPRRHPTSRSVGTHRDLAAATGGRAIVNTNDIDGSLRRVTVENRAYYLLGYEPPQATDRRSRRRGRFASARRSPGVELLHRSLYLPGMPDVQASRS